jgi:hypothetical protein
MVAGSISDEVVGFLNWPNPSSRSMVLGVDSSSNRNEHQESSWRLRAAGAKGWQPDHHLWTDFLENVGSSQPCGPLRPVTEIALSFILYRVSVWKVSKIKKYILETNCHIRIRFKSSERRTLKDFFMPGVRAYASWWPSVSSGTMSTPQEQVQCLLWLGEFQSLRAVQRCFRTQYGR